ncbi:hypothetical protein RUND412_010613 [Rhizina undulata]
MQSIPTSQQGAHDHKLILIPEDEGVLLAVREYLSGTGDKIYGQGLSKAVEAYLNQQEEDKNLLPARPPQNPPPNLPRQPAAVAGSPQIAPGSPQIEPVILQIMLLFLAFPELLPLIQAIQAAPAILPAQALPVVPKIFPAVSVILPIVPTILPSTSAIQVLLVMVLAIVFVKLSFPARTKVLLRLSITPLST